jgi:hypothetical protein
MRNKLKLRLYLYLEAVKPPWQKHAMRAVVYCYTGLFQLPDSLKLVMYKEVKAGDFKSIFRRFWWLSNQLILKGGHRFDLYFDFSIGLDSSAAKDVYARLIKTCERSNRTDSFDAQIWLAQLASAIIDGDLMPGEELNNQKPELLKYDDLYQTHINRALSCLRPIETRILDESDVNASKSDRTVSQNNPSQEKPFSPRKNQFGLYAKGVYESFIKLLEDAGMPVFAISGTLLGIIRENDFLAHDYDIDLGLLEENIDFDVLLSTIDQSEDFYVKKADYPSFRETDSNGGIVYRRQSNPALIKVGHRTTGVHIDLFTHFKDGHILWHGSTLHRWDNSSFSLTTTFFLGMNVLIPDDADLYLTENYGDWRTPVKKFNCSTGTPNASVSANPRTLCYYIKLSLDNYSESVDYAYVVDKLIESRLVKYDGHTFTLA